jgi:MFS family permease
MSTPASAAQPSILAHRPFALFWTGRVMATTGFQLQSVAVGWQVYELTGSALDLGLVGLAQFLPMLALTLVTGHVADRYDRRTILVVCQIVKILTAAAFALGSILGGMPRAAMFAVIFVLGAARAFEMPALQALLPGVVPETMLPRAIAASASANQAATIGGPAIGGVLYAASPPLAYAVCGLLFLGCAVSIGSIRVRREVRKREPVTLQSLFAGVRFIRGHPVMLGAISLDLFAVLLGGATALLPIYAKDILHIGPGGLGLLRAGPAIGALAMALYLARHPLQRHVGRKMFGAVAVFGIATMVFGVSSSFPLSLAMLIVLGASDMVSVVVRSSIVQLETPDGMRGRVSAVNSMFIGSSNQLGEFESGLTAAWFGVVPAVVLGGAGTLLVVLLWLRLFPGLAHADRLVGRRSQQHVLSPSTGTARAYPQAKSADGE